jgi:hypothetical protein
LEQLASLLAASTIARFRQSYWNVYGEDGFRWQLMESFPDGCRDHRIEFAVKCDKQIPNRAGVHRRQQKEYRFQAAFSLLP